MKVIILKGIPASGKTTYARQWINEDPDNRVRFNRDDIRNMLGKYWMPKREKLIDKMFYIFLTEALRNYYDIIIDNMNLNPKYTNDISK
jgi:predicted kinase